MPHEGKKNIRQAVRQHFATLTDTQKEACAERIFAKVEALEPFARARTVAFYQALPDEVPTAAVIEKWSGGGSAETSDSARPPGISTAAAHPPGAGKRIVLPCVEHEKMVFRTLCGETRRGCFGIEEPLGEIVPPSQIDLMIVPGVAFNLSGRRLGRGKGFYDRFLASCNTKTGTGSAAERNAERHHIYTVGICFPFQLVETLPCEPHDQPVDTVITCDLQTV